MIIVCVNLQWRRWRPSRKVWLIPTRIWAIGIEETHVLPTGQEFCATTHHYLMAIFMFKNCMIQSFWFLSVPCSISDWMEISSFFWFSCFLLSPICGEILFPSLKFQARFCSLLFKRCGRGPFSLLLWKKSWDMGYPIMNFEDIS